MYWLYFVRLISHYSVRLHNTSRKVTKSSFLFKWHLVGFSFKPAILIRANSNHRRWVCSSKVQMMILSKYTRLCVQGTSEASRCHLSIGKDLLSAGIVFDELSVLKVSVRLILFTGSKTLYLIVMVLPI